MQAEAAAQDALLRMQPVVEGSQGGVPRATGVSMLPLQELKLELLCRLDGTLLPTISACCRQLTQLHLRIPYVSSPADLRPMHKLQELTVISNAMWTAATLQSISSLAHLTKIESCALGPDSFEHLPVSLVELVAQQLPYCSCSDSDQLALVCQADLRRLTNLTRLQLGNAQGPQLPAQLQELEAGQFTWDDGFLQLSQLRTLQLWITPCADGASGLASLSALTRLSALRLSNKTASALHGLAEMCKHLPGLPLVQLHCWDCGQLTKQDMAQLGLCTQLTKLHLHELRLELSVGDFARQLRQLQQLRHLFLIDVRFDLRPCSAEDAQPLVDAISQLCLGALRNVSLSGQLALSAPQEAALATLLGASFLFKEYMTDTDSVTMTDDDSDLESDFGSDFDSEDGSISNDGLGGSD